MRKARLLMMGFSLTIFVMDIYAGAVPVASPGTTPLDPMFVYDDKSFKTLGKELDALGAQGDIYKKMLDQYQELGNFHSDLQNDLNGLTKINGSSIGDVLNDMNTVNTSWTWTAADWKSALQSVSGGNNNRYSQLSSAYQSQYPALSQSDLSKDNVDSNSGDVYQQAVKVNSAVMTQATYQFNDINNQMNNIKSLTNDISNVQTDKESTDLNSRLVSQLAYIQLAMLRMQTLTNQQLAEARAADLAADKNNVEFASHEITP